MLKRARSETGELEHTRHSGIETGHVLTTRRGEVRRATAATLDELCGSLDEIAGVQTAFAHQVFAEHHGEERFVVVLRTEHHEGVVLQLTGHLECEVFDRSGIDVHGDDTGDNLHAVDFLRFLDETRFELQHALAHCLFHLFAQFGIVGNGLFDGGAHVLGIVEERRYALDDFLHEVDALFGGLTGEGFDAANAGSDTAFAHDAEQTEATGAGGVRAAAELDAVAKLHDAHFVAVLLTEEGHGAHFLGFFDVDVAMVLQR